MNHQTTASCGAAQPFRAGAALLFVALLTAACSGGGGRPDVLVVTVDTARFDHFSYTGLSPVETPAIDRLAAEGTAFLQAVAPTPVTLPSHASLWTGQLPIRHGVRNNGSFRLPDDAVTLAELLRAEGYDTAAFVAAAVLDSRYGLDQGFEHYDDRIGSPDRDSQTRIAARRGEIVVRAALDWLDGIGDRDSMAWVHLYDPHYPYDPPQPELSRYFPNRYHGEIAYVDRVVGTLLDGYRSRGRYDDALIVLTADHGESLGEHGERTHGVFIYDATIRIPLLVRAPGLGVGRRIESQVQLIDLAPTLLDLLGLEVPEGMEGRSLRPLLTSDAGSGGSPPAYLESMLPRLDLGWSGLRGLRTPEWKLVSGAGQELYRLSTDPSEIDDLAESGRPEGERMSAALARRHPDPGLEGSARLEIDPRTRRQLSALGYIGTSPPPPPSDEALPDPRQRIHLLERRRTGDSLLAAGRPAEAIELYREILSQDPGQIDALERLAHALLLAGRPAEAVDVCDEALAMTPENVALREHLARSRTALGRAEEAVAAWAAVLELAPGDRVARQERWTLLTGLGRSAQVADEAAAAAAADPQDAEARLALAVARHWTAGPARLGPALEEHWRELPGSPVIGLPLARLLLSTSQEVAAVEVLEQVLRTVPGDPEAALLLANLKLGGDRVSAATARQVRALLEQAVDAADLPREFWLALAEARFRTGATGEGFAACYQAFRRRPGTGIWAEAEALVERSGSGEAAARLARLASRSRRFDTALRAYDAALALDSADEVLRAARWRLLLDLGRAAQIAAEMDAESSPGREVPALVRRLVEGESNGPASITELPPEPYLALLGDALLRRGRGEQAAALFRRAAEEGRGTEIARLELGRLLLAQGKLAAAADIAEKAEPPASAAIDRLLVLAESRARSENFTGALLALEEAIAAEPLRGDVWGLRGAVLLQVGWPLEATLDLRQALDLGYDDPSVEANLQVATRLLAGR